MRTENETGKEKGWHMTGPVVIGLIVIILLAGLAGYFLFFAEDDAPDSTVATDAVPSIATVPPPVVLLPPPVPEVPSIALEIPFIAPVTPSGVSEEASPATSEAVPEASPAEPEPLAETARVPDEPPPEEEDGDAQIREALDGIIGKMGSSLMISGELVYHIVVTVDNLPRDHLPTGIVPLKRAEGMFAVEGKNENLAIAARNAERYAAYMAAIKATDSARLVELYQRFYPLFQSAYQELGYPDGDFNDRLVIAIDDLLAAPNPRSPVRLKQPRVLYEYANPNLEKRSAGQKIMIRIGRENAAVIKAKLSEIRARVVR
ncbi:MAG: DUF3014 domain-containing protein [Candidatus Accumulibacter sp.]|jgi:hypothetical protein|nr:DUF3014 domain-containing protein [Accumulibacter sp.]